TLQVRLDAYGPSLVTVPTRPSVLTVLAEEVHAPVLCPAGFAALGADGALVPVADDRDPVCLDAERGQIAHRGLRTPLAERQVVLRGPPLVTVAFDQHQMPLVALEPGGVGVKDLRVSCPDIVFVEIEVDVLEGRDIRAVTGRRPRPRRRRRAIRSSL